jgi:hypothetical protein
MPTGRFAAIAQRRTRLPKRGDLLGPSDEAREADPGGAERSAHHYVLGHVALRKVCQGDPLSFFSTMASPDRERFLEEIWRSVREYCDDDGEPTFSISELSVLTTRIGESPALLIRMPPPARPLEAHFVAIILKVAPGVEELPEEPEFEYFTLERGVQTDGSECTFLCAWQMDDTHSNFGEGPPANEQDFIAAIESLGREPV